MEKVDGNRSTKSPAIGPHCKFTMRNRPSQQLLLLLFLVAATLSHGQLPTNATAHRSLKKYKAYSYDRSHSESSYDGSRKGGKGRNDNKNNDRDKDDDEKDEEDDNPANSCSSLIADQIRRRVPDVVTYTPRRCCSYFGPTAVIVTHGLYEDGQMESYWEEFYRQLHKAAAKNVCFIMTGIDVDQTSRSVTTILVDVNTVAATNDQVPILFTTNPNDSKNDLTLIETLRKIDNLTFGPLVAIFNRGYETVLAEALVSGQSPLPYIGSTTEDVYGARAAETTLQLVKQGMEENDVVALCLNARTDLPFVGERCKMYYDGFGKKAPLWPPTGLECSSKSSSLRLAELYEVNRITAVYAHGECCSLAVKAARQMTEWPVTVGCMDERIGDAAFMIGPSLALQAFHVMSQINLPLQALIREDYDMIEAFFPSPKSVVRTDVLVTLL